MQPNAPVQQPQNMYQPAGPGMYPSPTQGPLAPPPNGQMPSFKHHRPIVLIVSLVMMTLLFIGALIFGVMTFGQGQDYKNNSDKKVAAAVAVAKTAEAETQKKVYDEKEKSPFKMYAGPANYGTLNISYPKTWSAYVVESTNGGGTPIDGYVHPGFVPGIQTGAPYALRFQVTSNSYATELKKYDSQVKSGKVKVSPFKLAKLPSVTGARVDGEIIAGKQGSLVLLPLRDKTILISTQSPEFVNDFNNIILPNFTFQP